MYMYIYAQVSESVRERNRGRDACAHKPDMSCCHVPPGEAPTRMAPIAILSSTPKIWHKAYAISGMKRYRLAKPVATALGFAAAFLKSSTVDVAPKPRPTMNKKTKLSAVKALSRVLSTAMIATKDLLCPQGKEKLAITYFLHYIYYRRPSAEKKESNSTPPILRYASF